MRLLLASVLFVALGTLSLLAGDLTITSAIVGKGAFAKDGTQIQYLSPTRMRLNHGAAMMDTIVDYGKEVIYSIDHKNKVVTKISFKDLEDRMQSMEDQMAGMPEFMTKMMFGDITDIKVEPLGTETVLGRPCKKVRLTLGKMVQEISSDPSLQFPMKDYAKAMSLLNRMPGQMGTLFKRIYQETARIKGVPLKTHVSGLMGMDLTTTATAVSTAPIPESIWTLPAGYKVIDGGKEMKDAMKKQR